MTSVFLRIQFQGGKKKKSFLKWYRDCENENEDSLSS